MIRELIDCVKNYNPALWLSKKEIWKSLDYFNLNERVSLKGGPFTVGCYLGISNSGSLLISSLDNAQDNDVVEITSGQVSVRKIRDR